MKILLVEDNSEDAEFLRLSLAQRNDTAVNITRASLISEAVTALDDEHFDVVLLDLNLPDGRGAECVERIQEADDLVPIVVLSGHGDEDFAVEILNRGVQDYLVKWEGDGRVILRAIRYAIERKRAEIKLNYLARLDWLTCLPNRQYLRDELPAATKRAVRGHRTMGLLQLDLDRFKTVNETLGHATGDALLRAVVERLKGSIREGDHLARLGGDEFAVLLEDVESPRGIEAVARKITNAFEKPFQVGGQDVSITASIGITVCPADSTDAAALLHNAEVAMDQAKQLGRNTFKFFAAGMHEEILAYRRLEGELKVAIEQGQLELAYQPQMRLADHRIEAVEALLSWKHPERGRVSASELMSVAEDSGYIIPIGLWMIDEACRQLERWESAGVPVPRVAIKVAAATFRQPGFHDSVRGILKSHSTDPDLIELELTERTLMDGADGTRESLIALKNVGVRIAIDDFGAGLSHLSNLRLFPLDVLKISRSVVSKLDASEDAQQVCSAILSIAHRFSLDVVADGVESDLQEAFLTRNDCLYGQGKHYSAPLEPDRLGSMLAASGGQATRRRRVTRKHIAARAG